jgi:hypothetical protein
MAAPLDTRVRAADLAPSYAAKRSEPVAQISPSVTLALVSRDPMLPKERSRWGVRDESPGARSTVVGVQTVEEFPDRPLGSEHVKSHVLPMLRNDLVFALRF